MKKTKRIGRRGKIPVFSLKANMEVDYSQLIQIPEVRKAVMEETFNAIKDGIARRRKSIPLFEVAQSNCYIELEKDKWKSTLNNIMEYYIENEDYNICAECRDLINKL
jgi:hypothetical protein